MNLFSFQKDIFILLFFDQITFIVEYIFKEIKLKKKKKITWKIFYFCPSLAPCNAWVIYNLANDCEQNCEICCEYALI